MNLLGLVDDLDGLPTLPEGLRMRVVMRLRMLTQTSWRWIMVTQTSW